MTIERNEYIESVFMFENKCVRKKVQRNKQVDGTREKEREGDRDGNSY